MLYLSISAYAQILSAPTDLCYEGISKYYGIHTKKDKETGVKYMMRAADMGNQYAMESLVDICIFEQYKGIYSIVEIDKIIDYLHKLAENGNAFYMAVLGDVYMEGMGNMKPDQKKAMEWYVRAADAGDADAQYAVAEALEFGEGLPQDTRRAILLYDAAANGGNSEAMCALGDFYRQGVGVEQNLELTKYWLKKAAKKKNETARLILKENKKVFH